MEGEHGVVGGDAASGNSLLHVMGWGLLFIDFSCAWIFLVFCGFLSGRALHYVVGGSVALVTYVYHKVPFLLGLLHRRV
jgi:hypothetical protein